MSLQCLLDSGDGEADANLAKWVQSRIRRCPPFKGNVRGVGIIKNGALVAAAVYTQLEIFPFGGGNIYISFAADASCRRYATEKVPSRADLGIVAPHWASRRAIALLLAPPFLSWGCSRITAIIDRDFKSSRRLCAGVGFRHEGAAREILPGDHKNPVPRDACIYGLLRRDFLRGRFAKFLAPPQPQAQPALAHAA